MDEEGLKRIRKYFDIPDNLADDDIHRLESFLRDTPYLHLATPEQVGNLVELRELRKAHYPARPEPFSDPYGQNIFWLFCCELLFVEGHYGPCCAWARATVEYVLYELCEFDSRVSPYIKDFIHSCGPNPGIDRCLKELRKVGAISCDDCATCKTIAENGDYVVHHRLDMILKQRGTKRLLIEMGVKKKDLSKKGFKEHEDMIRKALRPTYERKLAKESVELLYRFMSQMTTVRR
jgi:hypothetical protein